MAKYRITIEEGNGYHCSCCRATWTYTEDYDTLEEVQNRVNQIEANSRAPKRDDIDVEMIEQGFGDEIKVKPQEEEVIRLVQENKK